MLAAIGRLKYPIIMPPAPAVLLLCPQFRHPFKAVTPAVLSLCAAVMHRPRLRVRPLLRHDLDGDQPPRPGAGAPSPISPPWSATTPKQCRYSDEADLFRTGRELDTRGECE